MFQEALLDVESCLLGVDPTKRASLIEAARSQRDNYSSADIRLAAALGKTASELAGEEGFPHHQIFSQLLQNPTPDAGNRKIASVVLVCLGRVTRNQKQAMTGPAKAWNLLRSAVGTTTSAVPDVLKGITFAAMAGGGVAGGGLWAANRALTGEDEKLRSLEIQRDTYGQLNAEIKSELERRRMAHTPSNVAAAVDYLT